MWKDPIVEEIHAIRAQLLARFDGDFGKYCAHVRAGQNVPVKPKAKPVAAPLSRTPARPARKSNARTSAA